MSHSNGGICTSILVNIGSPCLVRLLLTWPHEPRKPYSFPKQRLYVRQNTCTDFASLKFAFTLTPAPDMSDFCLSSDVCMSEIKTYLILRRTPLNF